MTKLPKKLSSLMRVALADLTKAERAKNVKVDMDDWIRVGHNNDLWTGKFSERPKDSNCEMCFAGAVLAYSLDRSMPRENSSPILWKQMCALNYVREGKVYQALCELNPNNAEKYLKYYEYAEYVSSYESDSKKWRKDMHKIIKKLEFCRL